MIPNNSSLGGGCTRLVLFWTFIRGSGRRIFIHHQCWEVLPFCRFQRQRCIKIRVLRAQDFYTPLALKTAKGQHLPALVVYKNPSPRLSQQPWIARLSAQSHLTRDLNSGTTPPHPVDRSMKLALQTRRLGTLDSAGNFQISIRKCSSNTLECSQSKLAGISFHNTAESPPTRLVAVQINPRTVPPSVQLGRILIPCFGRAHV